MLTRTQNACICIHYNFDESPHFNKPSYCFAINLTYSKGRSRLANSQNHAQSLLYYVIWSDKFWQIQKLICFYSYLTASSRHGFLKGHQRCFPLTALQGALPRWLVRDSSH